MGKLPSHFNPDLKIPPIFCLGFRFTYNPNVCVDSLHQQPQSPGIPPEFARFCPQGTGCHQWCCEAPTVPNCVGVRPDTHPNVWVTIYTYPSKIVLFMLRNLEQAYLNLCSSIVLLCSTANGTNIRTFILI